MGECVRNTSKCQEFYNFHYYLLPKLLVPTLPIVQGITLSLQIIFGMSIITLPIDQTITFTNTS